ncbi:Subtilisin-like protease SBT3.18, partial [Thalictrum thalictroides]
MIYPDKECPGESRTKNAKNGHETLFIYPLFLVALVYIVYLGKSNDNDPVLTTQSHFQLLSKLFSSEEEINEAMLYSYKHSFSGFSAMLNSTQAATLTNMEDVVSVFRSNVLQLHTTRSWDFLGLTLEHNQVTPIQLVYGDDTVVGIFDT